MTTLSPISRRTRPHVGAERRRIGIVSTYPPTMCGLATFARALGRELVRTGHDVRVVRIRGSHDEPATGNVVVAELRPDDPSTRAGAADALSACDSVVLQHEFGIYPGEDGVEVLDLIDAIDAPVIVVLHTVPLRPTKRQKWITEEIAQRVEQLVVMSTTAHDRLCTLYDVEPDQVAMIPHGAAMPEAAPRPQLDPGNRPPELLTWGLLGPGKGIEHAINALAILARSGLRPRYTIAGVTHPNVFAREADRYRLGLMRSSWATGVAASVDFDDRYRDTAQLTAFVASSRAVVLPYDSRDQVTSGVLVDALAAGRPVIATAFPHAVELLSSGAGIVVPHADPPAMAAALRSILLDTDLLASMTAEAQRIAPTLAWSTVAAQYLALVERVLPETAEARS